MAEEKKEAAQLGREFELAQAFDGDEKAAPAAAGGAKEVDVLGLEAVGAEEEEIDVGLMCELMPDQFKADYKSKLAYWYSWLTFRPLDLISVLGGDGLFLIHAESLILHFAVRQKVAGDLLDAFQSARLMYMIERLLDTVRQCQGSFRLVFFDASCLTFNCYSSSTALLTAREAFLLHCKSSNAIPFAQFDSWESPKFVEFVKFWQPAFILVEDGGAVERPDMADASSPADGLELTFALMLAALAEGLNVALLYQLARKGRKILGLSTFVEQAVPQLRGEIRAEMEEDIAGQLEEEDEEVDDVALLEELGVRGYVLTRFIAALRTDEADPTLEMFARLAVLCDAAMCDLSLKQRALVSFDLSQWEEEDDEGNFEKWSAVGSMFLDELRKTLKRLNKRNVKVADLTQLVDLIDLRIVNILLAILVENSQNNPKNPEIARDSLGLSEESIARMEKIWTIGGGGVSPLFPISLADDLASLPALPVVTDECVKTSTLMKNYNPFLLRFLATNKQGCELPFTSIEETNPEEEGIMQFFKDHNWVEPGLVVDLGEAMLARLNEKVSAPTQNAYHKRRMEGMGTGQREQYLQRLALKRQQREANRLRIMGQSLVGSTRLHHPIAVDRSRQHVWNTQLADLSEDETPAASMTSSPKKVEKKVEKKGGKPGGKKNAGPSKKDLIIAKNQEALKEKSGKNDNEHYAALERDMAAVFSRHQNHPAALFTAILDFCVGVDRVGDAFEDFPAIGRLLRLPESQVKFVFVLLSKFEAVVKKYYTSVLRKRKEREEIRRLVSLMLRLVSDTYRTYTELIDGPMIKQLQSALLAVGFKEVAANLFVKWMSQVESRQLADDPIVAGWAATMAAEEKKSKKKTKTPAEGGSVWNAFRVKKTEIADFHVQPGTEATFQLQFMGPDMERTLGSTKDSRVCFRPDRWQKRLLDCVDRRESALVVAPTASGKTFIGYYAMDLVLRLDDSSCVAFVAPSKALAQQVFHEVHARFGSKSYRSPSMILVGELQKDTIREAERCQILVTVPYALELLLTSRNREFVGRLKYLILDEIHCISQEEEGKQLEHLIQLAPCPFIALSATVGNPKSFHNWLDRVKTSTVRRVHEIVHEERYADLDMYVYSGSGRVLFPLNGFACVRYHNLVETGFPKDLSLSSSDCLTVYRTVSSALSKLPPQPTWSEVGKEALQRLVHELPPETYFIQSQKSSAVTKSEYRRYWKDLSQAIHTLAVEQVLDEATFDQMIASLQDPPSIDAIPEIIWDETNFKSQEPPSPQSTRQLTLKNLLDSTSTLKEYLDPAEFIQFANYMSKRGLLPALVFNFSRLEMRLILSRVVKKLQSENHALYHGSEELSYRTRLVNKKRQDDYKVLVREREAAQKMRNMSREQRLAQGLADDGNDPLLDEPLPPPPLNIEDEFDERFNFANRKVLGAHGDDIKKMIADLEDEAPDLVEGLRRGIAIHHEALSTRYRRAVEVLFRMGYLRIVLTATSLALGVNMPCKSSVFAGNSVELTPLMFRQTSGRAGRRGYDNLGYIVFWNLPFSKIQRLIGSQLSVLSGEFPVSPTMVLRTMQLQQELAQQVALEKNTQRLERLVFDHRQMTDALVRMYTIPLFSVSSRDSKPTAEEIARMAVMAKYSVRFSVDLLQRRCALDENGELHGLNSVLMSLFDREPANLALHDLLVSGSLHRMFDEENTTDPLMLLLHVCAYCFHTVPVSYSTVKRIQFGGFEPTVTDPNSSSSRPLLPNLPSSIVEEINKYNQRILTNSTAYVRAMASFTSAEHEIEDHMLPFSRVDFNKPSSGSTADGTIKSRLLGQLLPDSARNARSPFAAMCGRSDSNFLSAEDLILNSRSNVYLEHQMVPVIDHDTTTLLNDQQGEPVPLINSYILDFFREKTLAAIIRRNGINSSEAWYHIHNWKVTADALTRVLDDSARAKNSTTSDPFCVQFRQVNANLKKLITAIGT